MSLYDDASLIMYPSGYKEDKIYSLKPTDGSGDLTFTRASSATRVNAEGLIEGERTNLLLQSNTFNTSWVLSNATVSSGATDPNGGSTAWTLSKTASQTFHLYQNTASLTGNYTFSVYAKAGTNNEIRVDFNNAQYIQINLVNGSIVGSGGLISNVRENVGDGWWRISISANISSNTLVRFGHGGSGATGSILLWSSQLEVSDFGPTEYIPTTTTAVSVGITNNVPRIDYTGGGCGKLLLEPQRTNLVTQSEAFDSSDWTKNNSSVTSNFVTSPDGSLNADKLVENTSNNYHYISDAFSIVSGSYYSFSIFLKKGERKWLKIDSSSGANWSCGANFDLENGVVGSIDMGSAKIESYGNDWYRCSIIGLANANTVVAADLILAIGDNNVSYQGDGTSGVYLWGAQLEQGYATSYIPTAGATVTRTQDSSSTTGLSSVINSPEGVFYYDCVVEGNENGCGLTLKNTGSVTDRVDVGFLANLDVRVIYTKSGVNEFISSVTTYAIGQNLKIAIKWALNDLAVWVNGVEVATDTTGINPITAGVLNELVATTSTGSLSLQNLMVFPSALTDDELETLTTL